MLKSAVFAFHSSDQAIDATPNGAEVHENINQQWYIRSGRIQRTAAFA
jgi:hypothetical protein